MKIFQCKVTRMYRKRRLWPILATIVTLAYGIYFLISWANGWICLGFGIRMQLGKTTDHLRLFHKNLDDLCAQYHLGKEQGILCPQICDVCNNFTLGSCVGNHYGKKTIFKGQVGGKKVLPSCILETYDIIFSAYFQI